MIVADSSVWVDHLNGRETAPVRRLRRALAEGEVVLVPDPVVTEVLQGIRSDTEFERVRKALTPLGRPAVERETYVRAARLYRSLRAVGVTVRGAVDCIVAQTCIDLGVEIVASDADFRRIAQHSGLRLANAP